jgi:hypothetical protein
MRNIIGDLVDRGASAANFRQEILWARYQAGRLIGRASSPGSYIVYVLYIFHSHVRVHEEVLYEAHYRAPRPIGRLAAYDMQDSVHQDASRTRAWRETSHYCAAGAKMRAMAVTMRPQPRMATAYGWLLRRVTVREDEGVTCKSRQHLSLCWEDGSASCPSAFLTKCRKNEARSGQRILRSFSPRLRRNVEETVIVNRKKRTRQKSREK